MPIQVKDYTWKETDQAVLITVPLKGIHPSKVDIFSTDDYLKVSYPPYLFEVFLFDEVKDENSKATFGTGAVKFQLEKKNMSPWNQLQASESGDKDFMICKRKEAIEKAHKKAEEEKEIKATMKREQEKIALREQMKLEEEERAKIDAAKEEEHRKATEAIERWKEKQKLLPLKEQESVEAENSPENTVTDTQSSEQIIEKRQEVVQTATTKKQKPHAKTKNNRGKKELLQRDIPEPRSPGSITVSFTPRSFKTAARESKAPEEEEWLKKMASVSCNKQTTNSDAVDMEEMNPLWLKDKGNGFYKAGNYVAAINAYTAAIVLDDSVPLLYSNRAACHLQLKQYKECIQDCTSALQLLVPPVPANCSSRCKAHVRRGTAYWYVEEYVLALQDYEASLKLYPKNTELQRDAERIRNIIQGSG